jgi:hypothetical protein
MLKRVLILVWGLIFSFVLLLTVFPKLVVWAPRPSVSVPFMVFLMLFSLVYGVVWVFREGMKRATRK